MAEWGQRQPGAEQPKPVPAREWKVSIDQKAGLEEEMARVYEVEATGRVNLIAKCHNERTAHRIVAAFDAATEAGVRI